jgi:hypothetical protein
MAPGRTGAPWWTAWSPKARQSCRAQRSPRPATTRPTRAVCVPRGAGRRQHGPGDRPSALS